LDKPVDVGVPLTLTICPMAKGVALVQVKLAVVSVPYTVPSTVSVAVPLTITCCPTLSGVADAAQEKPPAVLMA
jgi:hypothetical protein